MILISNTEIKKRRGKSAVWLEGQRLAIAFAPHESFRIEQEGNVIRFVRDESGEKSVSVRTKDHGRDVFWPLLEVRDDDLWGGFGLGAKIRVTGRPGLLVFTIHGAESAREKRETRYKERIRKNEPLRLGSFLSGIGVLDKSIVSGLDSVGVKSYLALVIERESKYLEVLMRNQSDLLRDDTIVINSRIEDVELRNTKNFSLDGLIGSLPCPGSSPAGKAKNGNTYAEEHEDGGAVFFWYLRLVAEINPAWIVLENVTQFLDEMSWLVVKSVLTELGYNVNVEVLNGVEYGSLEDRDRMCMVAVSKGLTEFDFGEYVKPLFEKPESVSSILDVDVFVDTHDAWKSYDYLKIKAVSDKAKGNNFACRLYDGSEEKVVTIRRFYHKAGSSDPYVRRWDFAESGLSRKFSSLEHCRIKQVPLHLIDGVSETIAHEGLGQGVVYSAFFSVGAGIGLHGKEQSDLVSKAA